MAARPAVRKAPGEQPARGDPIERAQDPHALTSEREAFYSVDRLEGAVAVLVRDDGVGLDILKRSLPMNVHEGLVLRVRLDAAGQPDWSSATIDDAERERRLREARDRLERLRDTDPGGDIVL